MKFIILADPALVFIVLYFICLIHALVWTRKREEILHVHHMTTPKHKNPCPGGHEIYNFGGPFLGHHCYTLCLSNLCLGVEKNIFKEIMYFHYITYMTTHKHKNPYPRGHEFRKFLDPSPVIITML